MAERGNGNWDGRNERKWHVNRDVSVSDLVVFLSMLGALSLGWGKLDTRVSLLEQAQTVQVQANDRTTTRIEQNIQEINQKLDRLIERRQ